MRAHWLRHALPALLAGMTLALGLGCRSQSLNRNNALVRAVQQRPVKAVRAGATQYVLEEAGLDGLKPSEAFAGLESRAEVAPTPELLLALSELALRAGAKAEHGDRFQALDWYRKAAVYSAFALGEPETSGIDPLVAQEVHERAVVKCLRISGAADKEGKTEPLQWQTTLGSVGITVAPADPTWQALQFEQIWVASDFRYRGLENQYEREGLGVPVVLYRDYRDEQGVTGQESFFPKRLRLGATVILRPAGSVEGGAWRSAPIVLELCNPIDAETVQLGSMKWPLAADFTTPIAHQFIDSPMQVLEYEGLLNPDAVREFEGVYLSEPYEPGKIPVLFLHGLWSSPRTWLEVFNEVRGDPELRNRYQLWFGYYTTGDPVPVSAAKMRESLRKLRMAVDPSGQEPAMGNMVVVGHSMGSVVSRSMVQSSGDAIERRLLSRPLDTLQMSPESREKLQAIVRFEADPKIRRTLWLAGPFRGSGVANQAIGRFTSSLVRKSRQLEGLKDEITALNGEDVFKPPWNRRLLTGIDNLEENSPLLVELDKLPIAPWVTYHTVVGNINGLAGDNFERMTDGVVPAPSAHMDGAASERIIPRSHFMVSSPEVIDEVQRVLRLHLAESGGGWSGPMMVDGMPGVEMPGIVARDVAAPGIEGDSTVEPYSLPPAPSFSAPLSEPASVPVLPPPPPEEGVGSPFGGLPTRNSPESEAGSDALLMPLEPLRAG